MCSVDGEEQGAPARCPAQPRQRPPGTGSGGNGSPRRPEGKQRRKPDAPACVTVDGSTTSGAPPPRGNANSLKRAEPGGRGSGRQGEAQATAHTVTIRPEPSCRGDDPGWMRRGGHRAHGAALLAHVTFPLFGQGPTLSAYRASVTWPVPCLRTVKSVRMTSDPRRSPEPRFLPDTRPRPPLSPGLRRPRSRRPCCLPRIGLWVHAWFKELSWAQQSKGKQFRGRKDGVTLTGQAQQLF